MRYVVEGEFYDASDWYTDLDWHPFRWQFPLQSGWEYNHRYVDREIVKSMYAGMPAEDILKEIMTDTSAHYMKQQLMGDVKIDPNFNNWDNIEEWRPSWISEWKVTSTAPTIGSRMVHPFSI